MPSPDGATRLRSVVSVHTSNRPCRGSKDEGRVGPRRLRASGGVSSAALLNLAADRRAAMAAIVPLEPLTISFLYRVAGFDEL